MEVQRALPVRGCAVKIERELCYAVDWARLFCDGIDKIDTGERGGGKEKKRERKKGRRR